MKTLSSLRKQEGLTLIELMIALLIGSAIIGGIMSAFITTNRSVMLNDALSRNQETGRFALEYITQFARMAGYNESVDPTVSLNRNIPLYITSPGIDCNGVDADACAGNDMGGMRGDRIAFPYFASEQPITDCMGGSAGGLGNPPAYIVNVFWVDNDRTLMCQVFDGDTKAWVGAPVPLVTGVETMEFLVGVADGGGTSVTRYLTVDQVDADGLENIVRSVRIALLMNSEEVDSAGEVDTNIQTRSYSVLDRRMPDYNDGNLRHVFTTTVSFLNTRISTE